MQRVIVGAATVAARTSLAWERKTDRAEPCPYNFSGNDVVVGKLKIVCLDRL